MKPSTDLLSFREKFAYGLGDTASNFYFQAFNLFLVYYYTDVFGLSAASVGTMVLACRVLDAVLDPLMGIVADRTRSRWGKFRPYLLFGAVPYGILGYLMFSNPALSPAGKLVFAYVTYSLMWAAYTAINIPYSALMGVMSPSSKDRTSLSSFRFTCAFSGAFLISALTVPLKNLLGGNDPAEGFRYTMAIFSVISVAMFLYTFWQVRERVQPLEDKNTSLRKDFTYLFSNGPWLALLVVAFLTMTNVGIRNASIIYYFKYNVGDETKFTLFSTAGSLAFIAGAFSTKLFVSMMCRRNALVMLTMINATAMAAFFFVDPKQLSTLHVLNVIAAFSAGPTPAIIWSMYADTADFGEWKFGRRTTGLIFSATVFAQKVGLAVGSALLGWLLAFFDFVPNAVQSGRTVFGIKLLFSLLPAFFGILSGLGILFYKLSETQVKTIEQDLAARNRATTLRAEEATVA